MMQEDEPASDIGWDDLFEDRYGLGACERLTAMFDQPCITFAEIGARFGVTRERVRQWHVKLRPNAPRGHERQRLCVARGRKMRLLTDPLFRSFYRHARSHFQPSRFVLIPARDGFRKRVVRLDHHVIAIRKARRSPPSGSRGAVFTLTSGTHDGADFIYYRLGEDDYLFLPREAIPPSGTTFLDSRGSKYEQFRNTFAAVLPEDVVRQQAS